MAKIVKSGEGYWVAKETRPGNFYGPHYSEEWFKADTQDLSKEEAAQEATKTFGITISPDTPEFVLNNIVQELPNSANGNGFAFDGWSPSGIVKVIEEK